MSILNSNDVIYILTKRMNPNDQKQFIQMKKTLVQSIKLLNTKQMKEELRKEKEEFNCSCRY